MHRPLPSLWLRYLLHDASPDPVRLLPHIFLCPPAVNTNSLMRCGQLCRFYWQLASLPSLLVIPAICKFAVDLQLLIAASAG
jgi:hypothetical protein